MQPQQNNVKVTVDNNFIKGLITEATELNFPENASTETYDCLFSHLGYVTRRGGIDYEVGYVNSLQNSTATDAYNEFIWNAVAGNGSTSFLVQQQGNNILFYDISNSVVVSPNKKTFQLTLNTYIPAGTLLTPGNFPCQFASGRGTLVIVNRAMKPIYVTYDPAADTITATAFDIQTRDFVGVSDAQGLSGRPTDTVATLKSGKPEHFYNLLNQGWGENLASALSAWDTARTDIPSNADYIALYRSSPTVNFDNNRVLNQDPLNTPAPKGHFILNVANPDRNAAMVADGFAGASLTQPAVVIGTGVGTLFYAGLPNNPPQSTLFDSATSVVAASSVSFTTTASYAGKNFSGSPKQIAGATIYGSNDQGFINGSNPAIVWTLYAKQTAPANSTDGTSLGTVSFTDTANESGGRAIVSNDLITFWNYVWITCNTNAALVAEIQFTTPGPVLGTIPSTTERPSAVCFFTGRLFYAGLNAFSLNNTIFFTQILQQESQYGQCYQQNDPTSEYNALLLPSDGGTIVIPEAATIRRLFPYQNSLLVLASNGVWMVTGVSQTQGFTATAYSVRRLSNVGTNSPLSVVDRKGVPMWWAEDGIYTVHYDARYNSFEVVNTTLKTIRSFFIAINQTNRQYVKGAYDFILDQIYWVYNDTAGAAAYSYNKVLIFNGVTEAFYPWTISAGTPVVHGLSFVADPNRINGPIVAFTTTVAVTGSTLNILYSNAFDTTNYQDWMTTGTPVDYSSYLITGFRLYGQTQRFFETNYVFVFLENVQSNSSSLLMQGVWDFSNNTLSGKYSKQQECYNSNLATYKSLSPARIKVRGRGRSLRLKFFSTTGKPFQLQGWSIIETENQGL